MSNPWYTNTYSGQGGQIARAEQQNVQFTAIAAAFDAVYAAYDPMAGTTFVRTMRAPAGETIATMAAAASRANKFPQFDATGLIVNFVSGTPSVPTPAGTEGDVQINTGDVLSADSGYFNYSVSHHYLTSGNGVNFLPSSAGAGDFATPNPPWSASGLVYSDGCLDALGFYHGTFGAMSVASFWGSAIPKVADYTIPMRLNRSTFTNRGAAGDMIFTLPNHGSLVLGRIFEATFIVAAAGYLRVKAQSTYVIYDGGTAGASNGYMRSNEPGATLTIRNDGGGANWYVTSKTGTWTQDS